MNSMTRAFSVEKLPVFAIFFLLLFVVVSHTGESLQSRLMALGNHLWDDYVVLRGDIPTPTCNPNADLNRELDRLEQLSGAADPDALVIETFDRSATRVSLESQQKICITQHAIAAENKQRVTFSVKLFRGIETFFTAMALFAVKQEKILLCSLLFLAVAITTFRQQHIAFRQVNTVLSYRVSLIMQFIANAIMLFSTLSYRQVLVSSGVPETNPAITYIMMTGFAVLVVGNLTMLAKTPKTLSKSKTISDGLQALLAIPLYTHFVWITAVHFMLNQGHASSLAIFFGQMFEISGLFINIGLYIWIGLLLRQTQLGEAIFGLLKPWKLPPELLAFTAVLLMALPTAYTGASGIIIIAMGTVIYSEMRRIGTRRQLALATTALTGSAGVVLSPCLLVIAIAMLNKEVTTDELFHWGGYVFLLSISVLLIVLLLTKREPLNIASTKEALPGTLLALRFFAPYIGIFLLVCAIYAVTIDAYLDQFSAPFMLPVIIIGIIFFERTRKSPENTLRLTADNERETTVGKAITAAVSGATDHIGAILIIMACSFAMGGYIKDSGIFDLIPLHFSSQWTAMTFLVALMILVGMIMDAFGALILVSTVVASIAYKNGINPLHFWMMVLVAFELGYVTPPVALNHLLTRQVIGADAYINEATADSIWYKYERILLPLTVMTITLLLVAYVPLVYQELI